jgi:hypothetical protein
LVKLKFVVVVSAISIYLYYAASDQDVELFVCSFQVVVETV